MRAPGEVRVALEGSFRDAAAVSLVEEVRAGALRSKGRSTLLAQDSEDMFVRNSLRKRYLCATEYSKCAEVQAATNSSSPSLT